MSRKRSEQFTREQATPDQRRCWDCLSSVVGGDHHLRDVERCGFGIRAKLSGEAATFDGYELTWLVLAAHRDAVRIAVEANGSRHRVTVTAHPRRHGPGKQFERHPSLQDLAQQCMDGMDCIAMLLSLQQFAQKRISMIVEKDKRGQS